MCCRQTGVREALDRWIDDADSFLLDPTRRTTHDVAIGNVPPGVFHEAAFPVGVEAVQGVESTRGHGVILPDKSYVSGIDGRRVNLEVDSDDGSSRGHQAAHLRSMRELLTRLSRTSGGREVARRLIEETRSTFVIADSTPTRGVREIRRVGYRVVRRADPQGIVREYVEAVPDATPIRPPRISGTGRRPTLDELPATVREGPPPGLRPRPGGTTSRPIDQARFRARLERVRRRLVRAALRRAVGSRLDAFATNGL